MLELLSTHSSLSESSATTAVLQLLIDVYALVTTQSLGDGTSSLVVWAVDLVLLSCVVLVRPAGQVAVAS